MYKQFKECLDVYNNNNKKERYLDEMKKKKEKKSRSLLIKGKNKLIETFRNV